MELLARLIDAPPEPAPADRVTVHAPPTTLAGAQPSDEIVTAGGFTVSDAVEEVPP